MTIDNLQSIITGGSGAIVVVVIWLTMIMSDKLHTDAEFRREAAALEKEKAAHDETRKALAEAAARADAAVRASELIADAFSSAGHEPRRGRNVPEKG
jgi:hypothetical protein